MKRYNIKDLLKKIINGIKNYQHPIIKLFAGAFLVLIIINIAYYFASAYSPGCVVCHYMKPYYEQSTHSKHKDVSCVTCHPSRRILTAPYLLRYIAGSYNPRPRAEVDDNVCLDCHESQDLKKNTAFEMNISFNHSDHLGDLKRGKKLRCTSCHARGEEEEHFVINKNVCFTCHFKGSEKGHSATSCNVCHGIPRKVVEHKGFQFSHESYLKIGVDCSQCHIDVTTGNAEVSKKACFKCHIERTEEFDNHEKLHNVHISENGVDCEECHNSIGHGKVRMISSLEANCENCHSLKHSPQREMYIGSEGRGVGSVLSRMFAAQVSCEGCHLDVNNDGKSELSEKRQSCVKCHSENYGLMLDKWVTSFNEAINTITPSVANVRQLVENAKNRGIDVSAEKTYLEDAENNLYLVVNGKAVHNVDYAYRLLKNVANNIEGIAQRLGNNNFKSGRSKLLTDGSEYCSLCHFALSPKKVENFKGENFPHQTHKQFLSCDKCHSDTEHRKITVTKNECEDCHKNFDKVPENVKYGSINFPHTLHSRKSNIECKVCHASADFSNVKIKSNVCTSCHHKDTELRKECSKCHPVQNNTYSGNIAGLNGDADIMKSGGVTCEDCHAPAKTVISRPNETVCSDCHDESYKGMKAEWTSDIKSKIKNLTSLISDVRNIALSEEEKTSMQTAKKLIAAIKSDGSGGIHNYMVLTDLLDKSIKEINKIKSNGTK
jgi:hypothetical protein